MHQWIPFSRSASINQPTIQSNIYIAIFGLIFCQPFSFASHIINYACAYVLKSIKTEKDLIGVSFRGQRRNSQSNICCVKCVCVSHICDIRIFLAASDTCYAIVAAAHCYVFCERTVALSLLSSKLRESVWMSGRWVGMLDVCVLSVWYVNCESEASISSRIVRKAIHTHGHTRSSGSSNQTHTIITFVHANSVSGSRLNVSTTRFSFWI